MDEDTQKENKESSDTSLYYIIGAIALVVVIVAGYLLRPKSATTANPEQSVALPTPTPSTGPITQFTCEDKYYNPVVGLPGVYLSAAGVDVKPATKVDCTFTATVDGKVVATESAVSDVKLDEARGGGTWRCTTKAIDLTKNVLTTVDIKVTDDQNASTTCSSDFIFP